MRDDERLSAKLSKFRPSLTLELKGLVEERRRAGLPVYDFGLGETKGALPADLRAAGELAYRERRRFRAACIRFAGGPFHFAGYGRGR